MEKWAKKNGISPKFASSLSRSLNDPDEVPYLVDALTKGFKKLKKSAKTNLRNSLIRVQIYCSIYGNSDPIKLSKQLYIAQTLEKLMFGNNMLAEISGEEEG